MLDDFNLIAQRDPQGALEVAANQWNQANVDIEIVDGSHDGREVKQVVIAGMGGSALSALLAKNWLEGELDIPVEVVRSYDLPSYVGFNTLVIASSYSGNTEETVSCYDQAMARGAQVSVIASGGALIQKAEHDGVARVIVPGGMQPRMTTIQGLRALLKVYAHFGVTDEGYYDKIASYSGWLKEEVSQWTKDISTDRNAAKQVALYSVGKSPVFYAGHVMSPVAYKWKISWNENSKNIAFYNELPEFNHNEFMGWTSHPVHKPYAIFDLLSDFEHERTRRRFEVTDRLLSGLRPRAHIINLRGDSIIAQMMWASVLADFASIYTAVLNGVNPTPVDLIEKFKAEL